VVGGVERRERRECVRRRKIRRRQRRRGKLVSNRFCFLKCYRVAFLLPFSCLCFQLFSKSFFFLYLFHLSSLLLSFFFVFKFLF